MRWIVTAVLAALLGQPAESQPNSDPRYASTLRSLTGDGEREWVFERHERYMAGTPRCRQGESYHFKADGTVVLEKCDKTQQRLQTSSHRWTLEFPNALDVRIKIDETPFYLLFHSRSPDVTEMTLRTKGSSIIDPTTDRIYRHEDF